MTQPLPGNTPGGPEIQAGNPAGIGPESRLFSYNMDENKTPGGLKVRVKVRVITGPEAARLDARQARAILELLTWLHQHPQSPQPPRSRS
jgi:hypothetical protein